jgi:oligopeptide/dipeptide ABC transporter ATP-binding protein
MKKPVLSVENLVVNLPSGKSTVCVLHDVSFQIQEGDILGIVGESGSGKSVTSLAIMQLLPTGDKAVSSGHIYFGEKELTHKSPEKMQKIRGKDISMIFQEPMTSLNPVLKIGEQLVDVMQAHKQINKKAAQQEALRMLQEVQIRDVEHVMKCYPYELSGGMRQRVMIAAALSCSPALLIADEPTTALDVTVQAQVLQLLKSAAQKNGTSVLFISHDLGVIAQICTHVAVMYAGEIIETGTVVEVLTKPQHPYTKALLKALPDFDTNGEELEAIPGSVPGTSEVIVGCRFHMRCSQCSTKCKTDKPKFSNVASNHDVRCFMC